MFRITIIYIILLSIIVLFSAVVVSSWPLKCLFVPLTIYQFDIIVIDTTFFCLNIDLDLILKVSFKYM